MLKAVFLCGLVMILIGCGNDNSNVNNVKTNLDKNIVNQTKQPIVLTPDWSIAGVLTAIGNPPIATGDLPDLSSMVAKTRLAKHHRGFGGSFSAQS